MLQAWITSPRGSLYFAAPVTAYNLETLRTHVRALRNEDMACTCLSLSLGGARDRVLDARISALVAQLTRDGIDVRCADGDGSNAPWAARAAASRTQPRIAPPRARRHSRG